MSRRVFSFDPPDRFACGAIGQPGQRTFFLQAAKGEQVVSVALEKVQVAVLAERMAALLLGLRNEGVEVDWDQPTAPLPLVEPVHEDFRVGALTLGWDTERRQVLIEAREVSDEDEDDAATSLADAPDMVRVSLQPAEAQAFVSRALAVVQAGRPLCPYCGEPLDPNGHFCPRRNGYAH
jgi:uncharacterized repeat protein (TIGR03847 family)